MKRLLTRWGVAALTGITWSVAFGQQADDHAHHHTAEPAQQTEAADSVQPVEHEVEHSADHAASHPADHAADHPADHLADHPADHAAGHPADHADEAPTPSPAGDHGQHDHAMSESPAVIDHSSMPMPDTASLRDPHAYSNGYGLTTGPYVLDSNSRIRLADQMTFAGLWMDRFEQVWRSGNDLTELEGHAWLGDSYNRVLLRTETTVERNRVEEAEIDLMMTRAVSAFWDVQLGLRHQMVDDAHRHWAVIGLNGLAPYWFEVDASLFFTENGQTLFDLEAEYELRFTQRLVLQPRIDIHSYGKSDEELGRGSGLSKLKLGARLRYEFSRQFAPYLGVERVSSFGETADLLPPGEDRHETWWLMGVKFWF